MSCSLQDSGYTEGSSGSSTPSTALSGIIITAHFSSNDTIKNDKKCQLEELPVFTRQINAQNMNEFKNVIRNIDCQNILQSSDCQEAFNMFYNKFYNSFQNCFPLMKVKSKYLNRKPWLSRGLKQSIKVKNKMQKINMASEGFHLIGLKIIYQIDHNLYVIIM